VRGSSGGRAPGGAAASYRVLEDEAGAAHELLPHLLAAAIGEVVPRDGEALAVRHAVADLVHLTVHRPPLRLLRSGAQARRRRLGPAGAAGHEAAAAMGPPALRVHATQHPLELPPPRPTGRVFGHDGRRGCLLYATTKSDCQG
jgi:hypothetical protein